MNIENVPDRPEYVNIEENVPDRPEYVNIERDSTDFKRQPRVVAEGSR